MGERGDVVVRGDRAAGIRGGGPTASPSELDCACCAMWLADTAADMAKDMRQGATVQCGTGSPPPM